MTGQPDVSGAAAAGGGGGLRAKRRRAPAMSLTSLNLEGDLPPFFTFVVEQKLAACGDFDPDKVSDQLKNLAKRQVGGVITLTEDAILSPTRAESNSIRLLHLPTQDLTPPSLDDLVRGVEFIQSVNENNKAVVVHCSKGIGRTGTMLGAYFIVSEKRTAAEAIKEVRERRPGSIHKRVQEEMLYNLETNMTGNSSKPDDF